MSPESLGRRADRMRRLGVLYGRVEQMREMELHRASAAVNDMVALQSRELAASYEEANLGRRALAAGDTREWILAEAGCELIGLRMLLQRQTQMRLEAERGLARERLTGSRMQREQVEGLVENQRQASEIADQRRVQASSDDRFLARREWLRARAAEKTRAS